MRGLMKDNVKKWVEALRSGKYTQTTKCLQNQKGYCCLGVACDLYEKETGHLLPKDDNGYYFSGVLSGAFGVVKNWLGLSDREGGLSGPIISLAIANDQGKTFEEISDIIESEPNGLFIN